MIDTNLLIGITVIAVAFILFFLLIRHTMRQSAKDWKTLYELEIKAEKLSNLKEVEEFHKEFVEKTSKINNQFITARLMGIDGYLRGLYKAYNKV
jgi:hypothetical protein